VKVAVCCKSGVVTIKSEKVEPTGRRKRTIRRGLFLNEMELGAILSFFLPTIDMGRFLVQHQIGFSGKRIFPTVSLGLAVPLRANQPCSMDIKDDRRSKQRPQGPVFPISALRGYQRYSWVHASNDRST
jgi:hypothetical protein